MNPDPKPEKPILLKGKKYAEFRREIFEDFQGLCAVCGKYAPLLINGMFNPFLCGHVSHIKRRNKGGDVKGNVKWKCYKCHIVKEHILGEKNVSTSNRIYYDKSR